MAQPGVKMKKGTGRRFGLLALLILALCAVLLLRGRGAAEAPAPEAPQPEIMAQQPESPAPLLPTAEPSAAPAEEPAPQPGEESVPQTTEAPAEPPRETPEETEPTPAPERIPISYDKRSLQLVNDMVYAYKHQLSDRERIIAADVASLKELDPRLGAAWGGIMDYWDYANSRMEIRLDRLPEDLPDDDSLCLVVLGFKLTPEGEMSEELLARCRTALGAALQYPRAYIVVTGGGTAYLHPEVTEAGAMAAWFREQGIPEDRLIVEDGSTTTEENARNTLAILTRDYPRIRKLAIISSDYHLPLGCLLFTEAALLYECEYGVLPWEVVSNLGVKQEPLPGYDDPKEQMLYVWTLADPHI